VIIVKKLAW